MCGEGEREGGRERERERERGGGGGGGCSCEQRMIDVCGLEWTKVAMNMLNLEPEMQTHTQFETEQGI